MSVADLTWGEVKARSLSPDGTRCCADCYFGFTLTGFPCGKHITSEERVELDEKLKALTWEPHPFFDFIKKQDR